MTLPSSQCGQALRLGDSTAAPGWAGMCVVGQRGSSGPHSTVPGDAGGGGTDGRGQRRLGLLGNQDQSAH